ncbi:hypothetical protein THAOC_22735, partial [Thalassiosira oceanica]
PLHPETGDPEGKGEELFRGHLFEASAETRIAECNVFCKTKYPIRAGTLVTCMPIVGGKVGHTIDLHAMAIVTEVDGEKGRVMLCNRMELYDDNHVGENALEALGCNRKVMLYALDKQGFDAIINHIFAKRKFDANMFASEFHKRSEKKKLITDPQLDMYCQLIGRLMNKGYDLPALVIKTAPVVGGSDRESDDEDDHCPPDATPARAHLKSGQNCDDDSSLEDESSLEELRAKKQDSTPHVSDDWDWCNGRPDVTQLLYIVNQLIFQDICDNCSFCRSPGDRETKPDLLTIRDSVIDGYYEREEDFYMDVYDLVDLTPSTSHPKHQKQMSNLFLRALNEYKAGLYKSITAMEVNNMLPVQCEYKDSGRKITAYIAPYLRRHQSSYEKSGDNSGKVICATGATASESNSSESNSPSSAMDEKSGDTSGKSGHSSSLRDEFIKLLSCPEFRHTGGISSSSLKKHFDKDEYEALTPIINELMKESKLSMARQKQASPNDPQDVIFALIPESTSMQTAVPAAHNGPSMKDSTVAKEVDHSTNLDGNLDLKNAAIDDLVDDPTEIAAAEVLTGKKLRGIFDDRQHPPYLLSFSSQAQLDEAGNQLVQEFMTVFNNLEKISCLPDSNNVNQIDNYAFRIENIDKTGLRTALLVIKYVHISNFRDNFKYCHEGTCSSFVETLNEEFTTFSVTVRLMFVYSISALVDI